jgi:hypothetical protein
MNLTSKAALELSNFWIKDRNLQKRLQKLGRTRMLAAFAIR